MRHSLKLFAIGSLFISTSLAHSGTFFPEENPFPVFSNETVDCPKHLFDTVAVCRKLVNFFGYDDDIQSVGFEAPIGMITDGASIPAFLIPIFGGRWDREFLRASTLHDWYVYRIDLTKEYSYQVIQRMFYHALLDSNVDPVKAKLMYLAVLIAGNKHSLRVDTPPVECTQDIKNCLRNSNQEIEITAKSRIPSNWNHPAFKDAYESTIESDDFKAINPLNIIMIEEMASRVREQMGLDTYEFFETGE